jgi:hypothetical protein
MHTWIATLYLFVVLAGCGKVAGSHNIMEIDAPSVTVASDASIRIDALIPDNIIITGIVKSVIGTNEQPCHYCEVVFLEQMENPRLQWVIQMQAGHT